LSEPWADWLGRQVTLDDEANAATMQRLAALLDGPAAQRDPEFVPPLGHWLMFLPEEPQSGLGIDGHPKRGGFLPPIELPNRLWAGSTVRFHRPIAVGSRVQKRSTIASIESKNGRSGPIAFVSLQHEIRVGDAIAIEEKQDIAFRTQVAASPAAAAPDLRVPERTRTLVPDPTQLFRYSALTFNAHRIHYDAPYARDVEGHPGLVVHGPYIIATLLVDHLLRIEPGLAIARFRCQAKRPAYAGSPLHLHLLRDGPSHWQLWASSADGAVHMDAEVEAPT
jgi:3-methylfumaryl-CoA hydratase